MTKMTQESNTSNLLEIKDLKMHFPVRGGIFGRKIGSVHAVDGVSFKIAEGSTLGLVGGSGCGKSTLGKSIVRLYKPTSGKVIFDNKNMNLIQPMESIIMDSNLGAINFDSTL